jgi:hypothetical protein
MGRVRTNPLLISIAAGADIDAFEGYNARSCVLVSQ